MIWMVVGGIMYWGRASRPTAQLVTAYVGHSDLAVKSGTRRVQAIERMEEMLNGLSFEERQKLERDGTTRGFFQQLTQDEQVAFLDATLPAGFKQLMDHFNKMDSAHRKEIVDRALAEMKKHQGEGPPPNIDSKLAQRMIDQGMRSFYNDASADSKLDMAPLIEQMQINLQSGGR